MRLNQPSRGAHNDPLPVENNGYRLYVGNMGSRMTDGELRAMVERFGKVKSIHMVKDALTGNSDGYAFVEMTNEDGAIRVVSELNGKRINGHFLIARTLF
jgi:splicing factor U2AF subunit